MLNLGKPAKILVLIATVLPLIYMLCFFVMMFTAFSAAPGKPPFLFGHMGWFFALHMIFILMTFALVAFYVVFLFKTPAVKNDMKALWAVALFFGGAIAMTIFWYLYVWPDAAASRAGSPAPQG